MKVSELIAKLEEIDPDHTVYIEYIPYGDAPEINHSVVVGMDAVLLGYATDE